VRLSLLFPSGGGIWEGGCYDAPPRPSAACREDAAVDAAGTAKSYLNEPRRVRIMMMRRTGKVITSFSPPPRRHLRDQP